MIRAGLHLCLIVALTVLTQLGGLAWLVALCFRRRILVFAIAYVALGVAAHRIAPHFGRVPLPCASGGSMQMQSLPYCAMNRNFVDPDLKQVLADLSAWMDQRNPHTKTLVLDAGFPFLDGFPMFPHLSHDDGRKADIAFYYARNGIYQRATTRSPIGYFAFEQGPDACAGRGGPLRWDMGWLQPLWRDLELDLDRTRAALRRLSTDERVGKILIEPHLRDRLGVKGARIRFQGCHAARHDDHIHIQL